MSGVESLAWANLYLIVNGIEGLKNQVCGSVFVA
jgi:hypothetical protein